MLSHGPCVTKFLYEDPGGSVKRSGPPELVEGLAMVQKTGKLSLSTIKGPAPSPSHKSSCPVITVIARVAASSDSLAMVQKTGKLPLSMAKGPVPSPSH